ncbi:flippase [Halobaculum sp. CBA1158]|uniref:flippase n=1 Tax=Halobaculum sp. CBA1158 TaxID=2904243 RepID=UPI001F31E9A5|nr:flippase [Halobaculum sp. CBA1158]UIP00999.1 flippase [Halobaculum sp. CBA1158]
MSDLKRILKNASYLFIGAAIADASAFLFRVLIANKLGPSVFGLFSLALMTVSVGTSITLLGLPDGIVTYVSRFRSNDQPDKIAGVVLVSVGIVVITNIVLIAVIWTLAPLLATTLFDTKALTPLLRVFVLGMPAKSIIALTGAICLSYEQAALQTTIRRLVPKIGQLTTAAIIIVAGGGIQLVVTWYVVVLWLTAILGLSLTTLLLKGESIKEISTNTRELLTFSSPLFLSGFIGFFLNWTDTIFVGFFLTSVDVGIYQSAYLLGTSISLFIGAVANTLYPNFGSLLAQNKHDVISNRYRKASRWLSILAVAPTAYLITFPEQSLTLLFGAEFRAGRWVLVTIVATYFVSAVLGPATNTLKTMGYSRYILTTFLVAFLVNIALNLLLIPRIGLLGAAVGSGTASIISDIFHFRRVKTELNLSLPVQNIGRVIVIAGVVALFLSLISDNVTTLPIYGGFVVLFCLLYAGGLLITNTISWRDLRKLIVE